MNELTPLDETPTSRFDGDPDEVLAIMEKKNALAARMRQATEGILIAHTYPGDWTFQGGKACLASAGAERIGRIFDISFSDVTCNKETFSDEFGEAYRYVFKGMASLKKGGASVTSIYEEGSYSTRDEFLGKAHGQWRPLSEINEGDIRTAALHIFRGNAIKTLLGIRNLPETEYRRIMDRSGRQSAQSAQVERGAGTEGGTSGDDARHQKELAEICIEFANAGKTVSFVDDEWLLTSISDSDSRESLEIAKSICQQLSSFRNDKGEEVKGKESAKALKGKWLSSTLAKARKLKESRS